MKLPAKAMFRVDEVASLLGVHENTLRNWIDEGLLAVIRLPKGRLRVPRDAVVKLLRHPARRIISRGITP